MTLKLHNRRWFPVFFLAAAAVVIACLHPASGTRPELLLSGLGAILGFFYFLYRQHLDDTKLFKELFTGFNERYAEMNDGLNKIRFGPKEGVLSESDRELLFDYFNLCSEEFLFYRKGYIDEEVWQSWKKGMEPFFEHPLVADLWKKESATDSYYGFLP